MGVGERINLYLKAQNITVAQLARRTGIPEQTIYTAIRRGGQYKSVYTLAKIADALGVNILDLVATNEADDLNDIKGKEDIAERIVISRKKYGMTQKQLAEKSGLAVTTIQQYEAGKYKPKYDSCVKLSTALGVDVTYLTEGHGTEGHKSSIEKQIERRAREMLQICTTKELLAELQRREEEGDL